MTEQELREKIVEVISQKQTYGITEEFKTEDLGHGGWQAWTETTKVNNAEIADALIAAGIGDVSELKKHRVVVEKSLIPEDDNAYVLPNIPPKVKQLYSGEEVEQIVKERDEYKHRAEVAESALRYACWDLTKYYGAKVRQEWGDLKAAQYKNKAEKELAEEGKDE